MAKKSDLTAHTEFIEALSNFSDKVKKELDIQIPATYFEPVIKAHSGVVKEIERNGKN